MLWKIFSEELFPEQQDQKFHCEICKHRFNVKYKYISIKSMLYKIYKIIIGNPASQYKYLLYFAYLYLFCSNTLSIAKILVMVFAKYSGHRFWKYCSILYLTAILAQMGYMLHSEGVKLRESIAKFVHRNCIKISLDLDEN